MLVIASMSIRTLYLHQSHIYVSTQAWSVPLYNRLARIPVKKGTKQHWYKQKHSKYNDAYSIL